MVGKMERILLLDLVAMLVVPFEQGRIGKSEFVVYGADAVIGTVHNFD